MGLIASPALIVVDPAEAVLILRGLQLVERLHRERGVDRPVPLLRLIEDASALVETDRNEQRNAGQSTSFGDSFAEASFDGVEWLRMSDAATTLGWSEQYVRRLAGRQLLGRSHKHGGVWRVDPDAVEAEPERL